jgi:predicted nucleic acid-binding protein
MILIDTSIWIEFFKSNPVYVGEIEGLLENKEVLSIEPVFAELLFGCRNDKERGLILSYWKVLPKITFSDGFLIDSAEYANRNNFFNLGIGLIDSTLIHATIINKCQIWTLDKKVLNRIDKLFIYKS